MNTSLTPKQWKRKGEKLYQENEYLEAEVAFNHAADGFRMDGDELLAAEMDNNRSVAFLQAGKPDLALQAVNHTPEIFAQAGDLRRQALALGNQAASLEALKRFSEAVEKYTEASEILKQIGDTESRATVLRSLSVLQMGQGNRLDSLLSMHIGLQQVERPTIKQRLLKKLLEIPFNIMGRK